MLRKPVAFALLFSLALVGCGDKDTASTAPPATGDTEQAATTAGNKTATATPGQLTDLKIEDVKVGTGAPVSTGDSVWVLYTGKLANGKVFDSTADHDNKPYNVVVGAGAVIEGWDKGLVGMKLNGERNLSIPYHMGYGDNGHDPIPARSDLYFNIKLVGHVKKDELDTLHIHDVKVGNGKEVKEGDKVTIDYVGTIPDGTEFDSTYKTKKPVTFTVGKDEALDGFDQGVRGMKVGGVRKLTIPPALGLRGGNDIIPPNSVLFVTVTLKKIG